MAKAEGLPLSEVLDEIRNTKIRFEEAPLDRFRYAGDSRFRVGDATYELSPSAMTTFCRWLNLPDDLIGRENTFSRSAPDIDPPGVDHENPCVEPGQFFAQGIEGEFVVG